MKKSITKNYMYNTLYQMLVIILPLVTTPYVSRVLGAANIGIYSYTIAITTYFILFGSLGISLYGKREIAYIQDNPQKYSKLFWEIIILRVITMGISILIFYYNFIEGEYLYKKYFTILLFQLVASIFDISWFFQGLEEFKKIVIRNFFIKVISVACVFIFVKNENNLNEYFLIYGLSLLLGNMSLWLYLPKYIEIPNINNLNIIHHFRPVIALFLPQMAIQLYTVLDKVMIGMIIANKAEVAYYEQSQKIIKLLLTLVSSLGIVMMPRIANSFAKEEKEKIKKYMLTSINATLLLSIPILFGVIVVSKEFVPLFFGKGYEKVIGVMQIIAPIILFIGLSGNIGTQYLLPTKQQNKFTLSVIIGSIVNVVVNIIMIPRYGSYGAAFGTVIAELFVLLTQIIVTRNQFNYWVIFKLAIKYILLGIVMFCLCYLVNYINLSGIYILIIKIIVGGVSYIVMLIILKDNFTLKIINKFKRI